MAKQVINVGTAANDKKGDSLRAAFQKVNTNFTELYTALGINADVNLNLGAFEFTGSVMTTTDSSAIVIDQATTITSNLSVGGDIVPQTANGGDLGSSTLPWRSLYVSNNTIYIGGTAVGLDANGNLITGGTVVGSTPAWANITGKPTFATVTTTGAYADLTGKPTIPTLVSQLSNDSGFLTSGGGLAIGDFGRGFVDTKDSGKITTSKLYNRPDNLALNNHYELSVTNGGVVTLPDGSIINGATLKTIAGNYAGITAGPASPAGRDEDSWVWVDNDGATISTKTSTSNFQWKFDNNGQLTLPAGSSRVTSYGQLTIETDNSGSGMYANATGVNLLYANTNVTLRSNTAGTTKDWLFGTDGALTIPGDIRSEGNINIDINLSDSTLRRWQFGEDGNLTFPDGTNYSGKDITLPQTTNGTPNKVSWNFSDMAVGNSTTFLEWNLLSTDLSEFLIGTSSAATPFYFSFDGSGQTLGTIDNGGIFGGGKLTFGSTAGSNAGDANAIELKATNGDVYLTSTESVKITVDASDSSARVWLFDPTGNLTLPQGGNISEGGGISGAIKLTPSGGANEYQALLIYPTAGEGDHIHLTAGGGTTELYLGDDLHYVKLASDGNIRIQADNGVNGAAWTFGTDGSLQIPGDIRSEGNINIDINLSDSTLRRWQFGEDGNLTLPAGGNISEGGGLTGAIRLTPSGGANANQALLIYPTGFAEGDHLHLTAGGGATELYLGNDYHYVKLVDGGNVEIKATTANFSATAAWTFGTDGSLASDDEFIIKAPNGIPTSVYNYSGDGGWNSPPYTNLATTTNGSGTGLTVNVSTAVGGYIDINAITINTPGTGYKTGDLITITNENSLTGTFVVGVAGTRSWTFGTSGSLTLPIGVSIDSSVSALYPKIIADSGKAFSVQGQGNSGSAALAWSVDPNSAGQYAAVGVTKEGGDNLAKVVLQAQSNSGDGATVKLWKFDETGAFTFPDNTVQTTAWTGTTTGAITAESFNTDQITIVGNRISTTVTNANLEIETSGTGRVVINAIEDATTASTTRSVGYLGIPPANSSITRTLTIADSGKHTYITAAGVTLTIPAASSVAYPVGTTLTFIAGPSSTSVAIAITTDTMYLAGTGTTGTRTLAAHGMATAVKVSGTSSAGVWYINGTGLT